MKRNRNKNSKYLSSEFQCIIFFFFFKLWEGICVCPDSGHLSIFFFLRKKAFEKNEINKYEAKKNSRESQTVLRFIIHETCQSTGSQIASCIGCSTCVRL